MSSPSPNPTQQDSQTTAGGASPTNQDDTPLTDAHLDAADAADAVEKPDKPSPPNADGDGNGDKHGDGDGDGDGDADKEEKPNITPISFDLPPAETLESALKARIEQYRQEKLARLNRFAAETPPDEKRKSPSKIKVTETAVLGARRAAVRRGFPTGFDIEDPTEVEKRAARIARFGPPDPPPDHEAARVARAARFGPLALADVIAFSAEPPLENRRDVGDDETPRENVLHVFGVDRLSTREIVSHFAPYGPSWCEWLNDSSCNVVFEDTYTLARVLRAMSLAPDDEDELEVNRPPEPMDDDVKREGVDDDVKPENVVDDMDADAGAGADAEDDDVGMGDGESRSELAWRAMKPFTRSAGAIPIWGRMATEHDTRPERPNPKSKWSRTVQNKRQSADGLASPKSVDGKRRRRSGDGESGGASPRKSRPSRSGTNLGVKKDRDSSIAKAVAKKISTMDIDKPLSS